MFFWKPYQYRSVFDDLYTLCDQDTRDTIDVRLDRLIELGNRARSPISTNLEDGIFELRAKDARFLYYFGFRREIIFVHAIIKKRSDVPRKDILLAKKRRDLIEGNSENYDEIIV